MFRWVQLYVHEYSCTCIQRCWRFVRAESDYLQRPLSRRPRRFVVELDGDAGENQEKKLKLKPGNLALVRKKEEGARKGRHWVARVGLHVEYSELYSTCRVIEFAAH